MVSHIDSRDDSVEFIKGIKIYAGDVVGAVDEDQLRRIQIRETILSHLQRERQLFYKGIKVLSLFFIDEVANYREYDAANQPVNGKYAVMFEEEYEDVLNNMQLSLGEDDYIKYLQSIPASKTHILYLNKMFLEYQGRHPFDCINMTRVQSVDIPVEGTSERLHINVVLSTDRSTNMHNIELLPWVVDKHELAEFLEKEDGKHVTLDSEDENIVIDENKKEITTSDKDGNAKKLILSKNQREINYRGRRGLVTA